MSGLVFVVPGDPATRTGGYLYDRRIMEELAALGCPSSLLRLPDAFPFPGLAELAEAEQGLALVPGHSTVIVDGLALGVLPEAAARLAQRARLVALVHHPLAEETGLSEDERRRLAESERRALASAARVIVTGPATARALAADFAVPSEKITVVLPGTDPAPLAPADTTPPTLLCVGTVTPRKGHDVLLPALASLRELPWRLVCAGSLERDPDWSRRLLQQVQDEGLDSRIRFLGEASERELSELYLAADLFVLPSHLEGYGMALAEALARGLPLVTTATTAIAETLPPDCMRLVQPGDPRALTSALRDILGDKQQRRALRRGARAARASLPRWRDAGRAFLAALEPKT